jgi:hypothetical protein
MINHKHIDSWIHEKAANLMRFTQLCCSLSQHVFLLRASIDLHWPNPATIAFSHE